MSWAISAQISTTHKHNIETILFPSQSIVISKQCSKIYVFECVIMFKNSNQILETNDLTKFKRKKNIPSLSLVNVYVYRWIFYCGLWKSNVIQKITMSNRVLNMQCVYFWIYFLTFSSGSNSTSFEGVISFLSWYEHITHMQTYTRINSQPMKRKHK